MQQMAEFQALLQWQLFMGIDEAIGEETINHLLPPEPVVTPIIQSTASLDTKQRPAAQTAPAPSVSLVEVIEKAAAAAKSAESLDDLNAAVQGFDGCSLKKTARNTVFADGSPTSDIMIIGEIPDEDEDRKGKPFCGESEKLLGKMLAAIDISREDDCYLTNALFWRPPGNRAPTPEEIKICLPFLQRHIELFAPKLIIMLGNSAAKILLNETGGVMKLRERELEYREIPVRVTFHPSYLLRQPLQKKLAWQDLLTIQKIIRN